MADEPDFNDWNKQIIAEFRAHDGKVGGNFEGAPMIVVHATGRKTGKKSETPMMYLPAEGDTTTLYIFASKAGAPTNPDWYYNLVTAGKAEVEVGTETFAVEVTEVTGEERDSIYAKQVSLYPGFGEYEEKTAGIRTIPVLQLTRV